MTYSEKETLFYYHVLPYMNDEDITQNIYLISKNKLIYDKWYNIIVNRSSKLLKSCTESLYLYQDLYEEISSLEYYMVAMQEEDEYMEIIKDYIECLLDSTMPERNYGIRNKNMSIVERHIVPNELIYNMDYLSHRDTNIERRKYEIEYKANICCIYRMTKLQKSRHLNKCPYAKALIY